MSDKQKILKEINQIRKQKKIKTIDLIGNKDFKLSSETVVGVTQENGNPTLETICKICNMIGIEIILKPIQ